MRIKNRKTARQPSRTPSVASYRRRHFQNSRHASGHIWDKVQAISSLALALIAAYGLFFASLPEKIGSYLYSEIALKNQDIFELRSEKETIEAELSLLANERQKLSSEITSREQHNAELRNQLNELEVDILEAQNRLSILVDRENKRTANIILRQIRGSFKTLIPSDVNTGMLYRREDGSTGSYLRYNEDAKCAASSKRFVESLNWPEFQALTALIKNKSTNSLGYVNEKGSFLGNRTWYDHIDPWINKLNEGLDGYCYGLLRYEKPGEILNLHNTIGVRIKERSISHAGKKLIAREMIEPALNELDLSAYSDSVKILVDHKVNELRSHQYYSSNLTNFLEIEEPSIDQIVAEGKRADIAYTSIHSYLNNDFLYDVPEYEFGAIEEIKSDD